LSGWLREPRADESELCRLEHVVLDRVMANNGWIWGGSAMEDFAGPASRAYLRREVIAWSDSVKLRYGSGPQDCPYLWDHMASYTKRVASLFDGIRIDNCHSTPLHVGQYLVDVARTVNNNLYVMAELFTGSEQADNIFASKVSQAKKEGRKEGRKEEEEEQRLNFLLLGFFPFLASSSWLLLLLLGFFFFLASFILFSACRCSWASRI
jgi:hypothetical protein